MILGLLACNTSNPPSPAQPETDPNPGRTYAVAHTKSLQKDFNWTRYKYIGQWGNFDTTFQIDTTVAISVINDTAISFIGKTFQYVDSVYFTFSKVKYTTDTSSVLVYADKDVQSPHSSSSIKYHYKTGEVTYSDCSGGLGGTGCIIYTTK